MEEIKTIYDAVKGLIIIFYNFGKDALNIIKDFTDTKEFIATTITFTIIGIPFIIKWIAKYFKI